MLPILLILLLGAIDFGRVFFGYVAIQNLSRVAANYAATHSSETDWGPTSRFHELVLRDAEAINCDPVEINAPVFDPNPAVFGGDATVTIGCTFRPITPLIGSLVGNALSISAISTFPVRTDCVDCEATGGIEPPPAPPPACNIDPGLVGLSVGGARNAWIAAGFTGTFTPSPSSDDTRTVTAATFDQSPDAEGCMPHWTVVTATFAPLPDPPDPACAYVPNVTGMTVAQARTAWVTAGFEEEDFLPSGADAPPDVDIVTTQQVDPGSLPADGCVALADAATTMMTITAEEPPDPVAQFCTVPPLIGSQSTTAESTWNEAGFTGEIIFLDPDKLPYEIKYQSLINNRHELCTSPITVARNPRNQ